MIFDNTEQTIEFWNEKYHEIMTRDIYKLGFWNQFKDSLIRSDVVLFVVKTLDKIAQPMLNSE